MKKSTLILTAMLALAISASTASADLVGVYQNGANQSETMTIYYHDDQNVRIDVGNGSYMLVTGSNVYMVQQKGSATTATDMDQMGAMLQKSGMGTQMGAGTNQGGSNVQFKKTGRTETVAGYQGEVVEVTADGKTTEYVGSNDKDIVSLSRAFLTMGKRMSQSFGRNNSAEMDRAVRAAQAEGVGGMLRSGNDMRLTSLTKKDLEAGFYKLPAGTTIQAVPDMGSVGNVGDINEIVRQAQQDAARQAQTQPPVPQPQQQVDPATGIAKTAADAAQQETENQVRDSVQNAIRGLFGR